ncbi:uncharacterized protein A4U43_C08F15040 [Asparagus officinalis]|nr:uncharacterized protein A4U43_C08F15040 [Asparagus officinalis]
MERPTDSYKETHNIILANEDTYFGGQVSNLQVAELMAVMVKHRRLSLCKVVEVIAETTAPLTPMDELLAKIPPKQELPAEPKPDPIPMLKTESEPVILTVDKEVDDEEVPKPKPLSPFAMYADLKPPTSPCPTPSTGAAVSKQKIEDPVQDEPTTTLHTEMKSDNASNQKEYHLSPYIAYEDLKPPTSPTPTPSTISKALNNGPATTSRTAPPNVNEKEVLEKSSHLSPYYVYDDLKPPTSPMPSTPSTSSFISTSAVVDNSPSSAPLSPYTMYEDLKPPTSPVPSVPKY